MARFPEPGGISAPSSRSAAANACAGSANVTYANPRLAPRASFFRSTESTPSHVSRNARSSCVLVARLSSTTNTRGLATFTDLSEAPGDPSDRGDVAPRDGDALASSESDWDPPGKETKEPLAAGDGASAHGAGPGLSLIHISEPKRRTQ